MIVTKLILPCALYVSVSLLCFVHSSTGDPGFGHNTPPVFDFKREWLIVENEAIGSRVITVRARDAERDPIVYGIEPAVYLDVSNYFTINPKSGDVFLKESLIGKAGNDYYLYVTANDGYQTAKIETFIRVLPNEESDGAAVASTVMNGSDFQAIGRPHTPDRRHPSFPGFLAPSPPKRPKNPYFAIATPQRPATNAPKNSRPILLPEITDTTTAGTVGQGHPTPTHQPPTVGEPTINTTATNGTIAGGPSDGSGHDVHGGRGTSRGPTSATPADRHGYRFDMMNPQLLSMLVLVVLFCLVVIGLWLMQQRFNKRSHQEIIKSLSQKLPANKTNSAETTISSELDYNGAYFHQIRSSKAHSNRYESTEAPLPHFILPMSKEDGRWEFPRYKLNFKDIVGEGCFGQVWRCEAKDICGPDTGSQIVAVKTLKENASEKEKKDILQELDIMKMLAEEPHVNVVQLLGTCADKEPVFLIMEFVSLGKLQSYLRDSRLGQNSITSRDLTSFAYQVAKGMEFISSKGIIHRDLAARNILVDCNKTCKIADFGFARDVIANHTYERKSEGRLPIRWMAPESLYDNQYTTKSDVWSFGILCWEIVTLGSTPYPGLGAQEVMKRVREGYRLEKPEYCKREMYNVMFYCWDKEPTRRPSFRECVEFLDNLLIGKNDYIELTKFPDHDYYEYRLNNMSDDNHSGERL